jgi:hypothetical protein
MRALALLSLVAAVGCRGGAPPAPSEAPVPPTASARSTAPVAASLSIAVDDQAEPNWTTAPRVQLGRARHLFARLVTPVLPAPVAWVTVQLISPTGAVYQRRYVPFAEGPSAPRTAPHDGVSDPIDVQPARPVPGGWALELGLPVGGTNLERRPQLGTWRMRASLDGRPEVALETPIELY